ncbi:serine hydrolase domain-containing protein [Muriicola marianensis]|uniref:Serine hydrolase n=1 Tax=Muriicola marianensis TaxID=1324801 RepID=A0ABQ1QWC7_9FLAO|nr:serine hydrolase domain-containing protein [Muriicola marianensis]GGD45500.1 serine hydrolase [Muriicola marianensis]
MASFIEFFRKFFKDSSSGKRSGTFAEVDAAFLDLVENSSVPGLALTVLHKGKTLFQKGYGYADLERKIPVDPPKTIFRIASASKPIAAMALARMVADGKINLDESFYNYVPYFPKKEFDFTIRQLAGHTAGIRGYRGKEYALNKPYAIRDSLKVFQQDPLQFEPGAGYLYNSFDWVLISLAMEEVSGMPFAHYVREKVLDPLGMDHTQEEVPGELPEHTTVFYTRTRNGFRPSVEVDNRYKLAGGGYLSTTEDLARLGKACLESTLVPPDVMREFLTAQKVKGRSTYYGLGWQVSIDIAGRSFVGHVGNGVGGYSNFFVYPEEEMVISLLINCSDPKIQDHLDRHIIPVVLNLADI